MCIRRHNVVLCWRIELLYRRLFRGITRKNAKIKTLFSPTRVHRKTMTVIVLNTAITINDTTNEIRSTTTELTEFSCVTCFKAKNRQTDNFYIKYSSGNND